MTIPSTPTTSATSGAPSVKTIGRRLRAARGDASPTWVAAQLGVSVDTLQRYEAGASVNGPSALAIYRIAHLTNRPVDWFLTTGDDAEAVA